MSSETSVFAPVTGLEQRFPAIYLPPSEKVLTVSEQWFPQPLHVTFATLCEKFSSSFFVISEDEPFESFCAYNAAPYAPISAEKAGRITSTPSSCSKAIKTQSFKNVPP